LYFEPLDELPAKGPIYNYLTASILPKRLLCFARGSNKLDLRFSDLNHISDIGLGQHLPPFGVLLNRGVKTLAQLKAGNQSVTS
jgi:hypothetical protein